MALITLRPYQKDAVASSLDFFRSNSDKRPIVVAPTAAGKSIYIAAITSALQGGVMVLQPSKELLEQNYAKFQMYGGEASIYSASAGSKDVGRVTFATIGSLKGKAQLFAFVKYVLIDECHLVPPVENSMYMRFLADMPGVKVLGLTATAFRLKTYRDPFTREVYSKINLLNRERPQFFNDFLHITQIRELYEGGFLAPVRYAELMWDNGQLRYNSTGAEYSEESVDAALKRQKIHERIPEIIEQSKEKGRKFRLVFVKNVYDAAFLASKVPDSAVVHAQTPKKDREAILSDFRSGKITTVFNVSVLTIGFDFPALDTIIIARPTNSLALYMQMIGRGIRLHEEKEDCVVVDMCGNTQRFSHIDKIEYAQDEKGKWILRDDKRVLSGVKLA